MKSTIQNKNATPTIVKVLVIITILVAIDFWSFIYWPVPRWMNISIALVSIAIILFANGDYVRNKRSFVDIIVVCTIFTIFLSIIPAVIDYHQKLVATSVQCLSLTYGLFFYFVLQRYRPSSQYIIYIITIISVVWVFLELVQQLTYPTFAFSGRYFTTGIKERLGLWRFYIYGVDFVMLAYAYWLARVKDNNDNLTRKAILAFIFFAGLLCYGSRKHIYVTIFVFAASALKGKTNMKNFFLLLLTIGTISLLFIEFYADLHELNETTAETQGTGDDFIRYLSAKYYLFYFSDSELYPLFGAGMEVEGSSLWRNLNFAQDVLRFWQSDVGIIGYYSKFGLFGVSAILLYIGYFIRNWNFIDSWFKYFFVMKMILIVFDFWAIWDVGMTAYAFFLYLLDCNIKKNKAIQIYRSKTKRTLIAYSNN